MLSLFVNSRSFNVLGNHISSGKVLQTHLSQAKCVFSSSFCDKLSLILSGYSLLRDPHHNKGLAFTEIERDAHYLRGLLPPVVLTQELQEKKLLHNLRKYEVPLQRYMSLMDLQCLPITIDVGTNNKQLLNDDFYIGLRQKRARGQERNERLFYKLLIDNVEELLPVVYTPTVGEACQKYGSIFRRPQGLYISLKEKGKILEVLKNWPEKTIQVIVVTDGERILGLGDLGCQEKKLLHNLRKYEVPLQRYMSLMDLQERNERLFYKLLIDNVEELLPVVYTPTVGEACQKYGSIFRRPQGLYISLKEKGKILEVLKNWPEKTIQVIVVTDGERILGLGDLGCQCLPITIDVGTNNKQLLNDDFYIGLRQKRARGQEYEDLLHEFMCAVKQQYGEKVLIQFEDFANHNAFDLLAKYSKTHLVFNDDIQAGTGIAELIALEMSRQTGTPIENNREKIWLVDSKGLIVSSRMESLQHFKKPWAHDHEPVNNLLDAVKAIKPTVLIGTSGVGKTFTQDVVEAMASFNEKPVILALSNPTTQSECTAEEAYTWSKGCAIFASGSPFDPVEYEGKIFVPGQDKKSEALAQQVTQENFDKGLIYPPFKNIRKISAHIAANVAAKVYELGLATRLPRPDNLVKYAESCMYTPAYRNYR
ncbi:hypothetical protein C4D60_Mb10t09180 [Musa balbisiana]|uniref:Malic enzyme n=1 Tax=Musa balbisiana TaxID=52838 RepID=A0A4S8IWL8_MUSBA|nr:hypothetical protein C4D60_Mb10t09180 [Musa balbisiana]